MASILLTRQWLMEGQKDPDTTKLQTRIPTPWPFCLSAKRFTTMSLRRASDIKLQLTHKGENLKKKTIVKEIQQEHFIDSRKWITITCLSGDSNPNYPCLSITPCRGRPPVILPVCCSVSHCCCNISAGMPRIASWILCFNSSTILGLVFTTQGLCSTNWTLPLVPVFCVPLYFQQQIWFNPQETINEAGTLGGDDTNK